MRSRRESNTEATIAAILVAARTHFGRQGFEPTSLDQIATKARVTTGAIYHHFGNKQGLFLAVAEQIEAELLTCALSVSDSDPWRQTQKAFTALIDACATREVQRIIFLDAPRVIGPDAWRAIELKYGYGAMSTALAALAQAGIIRPYPVELIAPVLLAVLAEASRALASSPEIRASAADLVARFLQSLRILSPTSFDANPPGV